MRAVQRLRKALGYLDHLEFGLQDKLQKVRNVKTLVKNSIEEVVIMQKKLDAYDEVIKEDLKELLAKEKAEGHEHNQTMSEVSINETKT